MELEKSLLKVPCECASKELRHDQRLIAKETLISIAKLDGFQKAMKECRKKQKGSDEDALDMVDKFMQRLRGFKRKWAEMAASHVNPLVNGEEGLQHLAQQIELQAAVPRDEEAIQDWTRTRMYRFLCDYLLRHEAVEAGAALASVAKIDTLVPSSVFREIRQITQSLQSHQCTEALQWCYQNRSKLRKMQSTLEFKLRLQEYVEHIRGGRLRHAVAYAKKFLSTFCDRSMPDFLQAMGLLVMGPTVTYERYAHFFEEQRWTDLVDLFTTDALTLHGMEKQSPFELALKVGISVLKTQDCGHADRRSTECPVCDRGIHQIAASLPHSHHIHSTLVCRETGLVMNEDNPPWVLPNGNVYSEKALHTTLGEPGSATIRDPASGMVFKRSELKKAFVS